MERSGKRMSGRNAKISANSKQRTLFTINYDKSLHFNIQFFK